MALNKVEISTFDQNHYAEEEINTVYGNGHSKFMHHYILYLLGKGPNPCSIEESLNTIRLIESSYSYGN